MAGGSTPNDAPFSDVSPGVNALWQTLAYSAPQGLEILQGLKPTGRRKQARRAPSNPPTSTQ
jgi:hypothetical protein